MVSRVDRATQGDSGTQRQRARKDAGGVRSSDAVDRGGAGRYSDPLQSRHRDKSASPVLEGRNPSQFAKGCKSPRGHSGTPARHGCNRQDQERTIGLIESLVRPDSNPESEPEMPRVVLDPDFARTLIRQGLAPARTRLTRSTIEQTYNFQGRCA